MKPSRETIRTAAAAAFAAAFGLMQAAVAGPAPAPTPLDLNLPNLGTVAGSELSPQDEYDLGLEIMREIKRDPDYLRDPEISEYLNRLGYRLVSNTNSYTYRFFFFPVLDRSLNAFALPGGFIAVNTGTIVSAKSESELAGVMGHEIGHVVQRHIARMIDQQKSALPITIGTILLAILAARAGGESGGDLAGAIAMGGQAALIQRQLGYSQSAEREADRIGFQTLTRSGFDPRGLTGFFKRLEMNDRYTQLVAPAYYSTHPLTAERIADMENRVRQVPVKMHADSLDFQLVQVRAAVLQTEGVAQLEALEGRYKEAWEKGSGIHKAVAAYGVSVIEGRRGNPAAALLWAKRSMSAGKSAILMRNLTRAEFDAAKTPGARSAALEAARRAASAYPLSTMMLTNELDMLFTLGRYEEILETLRKNDAVTDSNPVYHEWMARACEKLGRRSLQYLHTGELLYLEGELEPAQYQFALAQKAADGDFYTMSLVDARLRQVRAEIKLKNEKK